MVFAGVFAFRQDSRRSAASWAAILRMYPDQGFDVLVVALIVMVLGARYVEGAFAGPSSSDGRDDGEDLLPQTLVGDRLPLLVAVVLLIRPSGLFREGRDVRRLPPAACLAR